jgi:hypothetical protein
MVMWCANGRSSATLDRQAAAVEDEVANHHMRRVDNADGVRAGARPRSPAPRRRSFDRRARVHRASSEWESRVRPRRGATVARAKLRQPLEIVSGGTDALRRESGCGGQASRNDSRRKEVSHDADNCNAELNRRNVAVTLSATHGRPAGPGTARIDPWRGMCHYPGSRRLLVLHAHSSGSPLRAVGATAPASIKRAVAYRPSISIALPLSPNAIDTTNLTP